MQLHRTAFAAAPTVVMPSHLSSSHHHHLSSSRLPRSPPTSPRPQLLDPADPELIQRLRVFLVRAAHRPPGITDELQELLLCKLAVKPDELEAIFSSSRLAEACTSHKGSSSCLEPQQLQELRAGLDNLLRLFSTSEVFHLLQRQPALLLTPLASWLEFFTAYGFSSNQIKNLILQTQGEVMTKGTLVTAGAGATVQLVVCFLLCVGTHCLTYTACTNSGLECCFAACTYRTYTHTLVLQL